MGWFMFMLPKSTRVEGVDRLDDEKLS